MPIYEYRCQACGAALEKLQKLSDPVLVECPECGQESLVKLVSASSFRLKGGGWYESDFKTGKKKNGLGEADSAAASGNAADTGTAQSPTAGAAADAPTGSSSGQSSESATTTKKEDAAKSVKEKPGNKSGGSTPAAAV